MLKEEKDGSNWDSDFQRLVRTDALQVQFLC